MWILDDCKPANGGDVGWRNDDFAAECFRFCGCRINIVHSNVGSPRWRHALRHFGNWHYAPDIDLATLRVTSTLPLSTAAELPLSLVWIALLSRRLECSLAASRGVETEAEVVKYLLVGADVVMIASALLRHGPEYVGIMREGLTRWLAANGFDSVDAIRGLKDATHVENAGALLRAQYVAANTGYLPGKLVQ